MKTYLFFAAIFFVPLFLLALENCFDVPHITIALMFSFLVCMMGAALRWVVLTLAKK
jgi:hypothetical protein